MPPKMRSAVKRFLPYWQRRVEQCGAEQVFGELRQEGKTRYLDRKDRMGLLEELGLRDGVRKEMLLDKDGNRSIFDDVDE